jgi:hypothetical protein
MNKELCPERPLPWSEQGLAAAVAALFLQSQPLGFGFCQGQPEPALKQGHLGRQVAAFAHFNFGVA